MKKCFKCSFSSGACSGALERIYAIQGSKKKIDSDDIDVGCPWFINSSEHKYSFWEYAKTLDEPVSDKDICDLLLIDQKTLDSTYFSAIKKLKDLKNTQELQDFKEALLLKISKNSQDHTIYLPDEFTAVAIVERDEEKDQEAELFKDEKKTRKGFGMPIHRDGKKVDIFFTSKKKREEINKNAQKNKK